MAPHIPTKTPIPQETPGSRPDGHLARSPKFGPGNRLVLIFCVLALIAVAANVTLIVDLSTKVASAPAAVEAQPAGPLPEKPGSFAFHESVRHRLTLVLGVTAICFAVMIYLFVSRVVTPLRAVTKASRDMAEGNLSITAPSGHNGELGELGHNINDLAVNFQEVLLLTGTVVGNSSSVVERIEKALEREGLADGNDLNEQITALRKDLEMLRSVVADFRFYHTHFAGAQASGDPEARGTH